jgi:hypothetical protein
MFQTLRRAVSFFYNQAKARAVMYFRTREVVRSLELTHQRELSEVSPTLWPQIKQQHSLEIAAARDGKFPITNRIVERRSWSFPYLPESLHRLHQPILKSTPYNLRRFCFSDDTGVLTRDGWKFWSAVTEDDEFITYNRDTGKAEWQKSGEIYKYWYEGEMYLYQNKFVDQLVTPDHFLLGRYREAANLWGGNLTCPECHDEFKTATGLGSHRHYRHGITGAYQETRDGSRGSYSYSKVKIQRACKVEEWQRKYSSDVYAFEAPFTAQWPSSFPKSYDFKTGTIKVAGKRVDLLDWVRFFGIYVAEGSCRGTLFGLDTAKTSKKPLFIQAIAAAADTTQYAQFMSEGRQSYEVRISQTNASEHNELVRDKIRRLLQRLPWYFVEGENDFSIHDKELHCRLFRLGSSYTKHVPTWLKNLPSEYLNEFIKWAIMGDGCTHKDETQHRNYFTVSERLANDMQEIFQRAGVWAQIHVKHNNGVGGFGGGERNAPLYTVSEHMSEWGAYPTPEHVPYKGYVYCADLPNKTVYVRRNGKPIWSGRSETPIPRRVINLIKNSVLSLRWKIDVIDDKEKNPEREKRIRVATYTLNHPNNVDSWKTLMEACLEDFLVHGAGTLEPALTPDFKRPLKLWPVDSGTIRIFADWTESQPEKPRFAQMTGLKGERGFVTFRSDELIYIKDNCRTNTPFGLGRLEVVFNAVNALLGVQDMATRAGSDQVHKTFLWWRQALSRGHFEQVRRYLKNEGEGQAKISMVSGIEKPDEIDVQPVTEEDILIPWQELLMRVIAVGFDVSPQAVGIEKDVNRSTSEVMDMKDWRSGVVPVASKFQEAVTRYILHQYLEWTDLEFTFIGLEDPDILTKANLYKILYGLDAVTSNTVANAFAQEPIEGGWGDMTMMQKQLIMAEAQAKIGMKSQQSMMKYQGDMQKQSMQEQGMGSGGANGNGGYGTYGDEGQEGSEGPMRGSVFSAKEVADMDPTQVEQLRKRGMVPQKPGDLKDAMEENQPGILEQLSEEMMEYFDWLEEQEDTRDVEPAKISPKDVKEQMKRFRKNDKERKPRIQTDRKAKGLKVRPNETTSDRRFQ